MEANHYVDTHCHIHGDNHPAEIDDIIERAQSAGVTDIITMGCTASDSRTALDLALEHSAGDVIIHAGAGIYPSYADNFDLDDIAEILHCASRFAVVAIGEIGIDHYDTEHHVSAEEQIAVLRSEFEISLHKGLPVSLHVRSGKYGNAFDDLWLALEDFCLGFEVTGVIHSFTGTLAELDRCLEYGFYIGVNGIVTFNKDPALDEVYRHIPMNRIVTETDSPFLAPVPVRSRPNEPANIPTIVEALAQKRGDDPDELAAACYNNACDLFRLRGRNPDGSSSSGLNVDVQHGRFL